MTCDTWNDLLSQLICCHWAAAPASKSQGIQKLACIFFKSSFWSSDLFVTEKQNMCVLCNPHEEFVFSLLGSRFFRVYLSRSPLSCSSTSSVAMACDEQLAAMLAACLSHISAFLSGVVSVRCSASLLAAAWYTAAKAEECGLQWVLTFTFAACPNW